MADNLDTARLFRTLTLVAVVTAVFLFVGARRLEGQLFQVSVVAIGAVALLTAIAAFLIAGAAYFDQPPAQA